MSRVITRAAVIGAGTMGSGIAAHFANAGIPVYLLDVVEPPLDKIKKHKPPPFFTPETANLVTAGKLDEHEAWLSEADWIVEAIVESLDAKRDLFARIDRLRKDDAIVTSNTSGLPIAQISSQTSDAFRRHFLGTHFFNPPRYMKLLEVIPTPATEPAITTFVRDFAEHRLGKAVVFCKDTPNFIANRLASIGGAVLMEYALANGYTIEEVDAIAGPLIGRPKTAAFRLLDLVGLDVSSSVASNLHGLIPHDESRDILIAPRFEALRKAQLDKGRLGDKTGAGFYKKDGKTIQTLDLETGEYRDRIEPGIPSLAEAAQIASLPERLKFVLRQDDKAGRLARHVVYHSLAYAARRVPEISDDVVSIDRATRWGFSHDLGPFELWDALGVRETAEAMEREGIAVAPWVWEMLTSGQTSFYPDRHVERGGSATLFPLGDRVLALNAPESLSDALEELQRGDWIGLVISGDGADFGDTRHSPETLMKVRFSTKPIVVAPFGKTLDGGLELTMAAARVVAAAETYMGFFAPGPFALKELVRRVISPPQKRTPGIDAVPFVQQVLQSIGKVSSSAAEARSFGFLGDADRIVMNRDHLWAEAKREVLELAPGYAPPPREKNCYAAGRDVRAAIRSAIYVMQQGGYLNEQYAQSSRRLADVLCGNWSAPQWLDESEFMETASK